MDAAEIPHLLFRWLHVSAAVLWIGQLWSLVLIQRWPADRSVEPGVAVLTVVVLMVSNHFPLVYSQSRSWLVAPGIVLASALAGAGLSLIFLRHSATADASWRTPSGMSDSEIAPYPTMSVEGARLGSA